MTAGADGAVHDDGAWPNGQELQDGVGQNWNVTHQEIVRRLRAGFRNDMPKEMIEMACSLFSTLFGRCSVTGIPPSVRQAAARRSIGPPSPGVFLMKVTGL
jgi:hypothetical protein